MDENQFDALAADLFREIEDRLEDVDPDDVEISRADGVIKLQLRDGVVAVINTQRPAREIWMAAVASAWHFAYQADTGAWLTKKGEELGATLAAVLRQHSGIDVAFS